MSRWGGVRCGAAVRRLHNAWQRRNKPPAAQMWSPVNGPNRGIAWRWCARFMRGVVRGVAVCVGSGREKVAGCGGECGAVGGAGRRQRGVRMGRPAAALWHTVAGVGRGR